MSRWNPGEEYIAFVRWEPAIGRYRPIAGPIFMIPVRDGKVVWDRTDAPTIRTAIGQQGDGGALPAAAGGAEAQFTNLIGARIGVRVLWRDMAEPSGGHPCLARPRQSHTKLHHSVVRDLRCSHASRGASTKRLLPIALVFATVPATASAQHFVCTTVRAGDTATGLAFRLTHNAGNRHQAWFQIINPVTSRFVSKDAYDTILPGWRACLTTAVAPAVPVPRVIAATSRSSSAVRPFVHRLMTADLAGLSVSWILALVLLTPFVAAPAAKTYLDRRRRVLDGMMERLPSRSSASSHGRCPGGIRRTGPIAVTVRCAPRRGNDWRSCSRQRRDTAIPTCRTTGRTCCTTLNGCFESSRIKPLRAVNRTSRAAGWSSRFKDHGRNRRRKVSSERSSFECRRGRREHSALREDDVSPRSGHDAERVTRSTRSGFDGSVATRFLDTNEFSLLDVPADERLLIGAATTRRLGSGHNPDVARAALEESRARGGVASQRVFRDRPRLAPAARGLARAPCFRWRRWPAHRTSW